MACTILLPLNHWRPTTNQSFFSFPAAETLPPHNSQVPLSLHTSTTKLPMLLPWKMTACSCRPEGRCSIQ
jgi:hypothetical protein